MDLFGNDFLVLYRYYEKYKTYIAERVIESKQDYLNYGFTKEQSMMQIEPISFFDEKEEEFEEVRWKIKKNTKARQPGNISIPHLIHNQYAWLC